MNTIDTADPSERSSAAPDVGDRGSTLGRRRRLVALLSLGVAALAFIPVSTVVYPGLFKLTAPVLCPAGKPDAMVVRYHVSTSDGQDTNFTLFCMDERGDFVEAGTWLPLGVLSGYFVGAVLVLVVVARLISLIRRARRRLRSRGEVDLTSGVDPFASTKGHTGPIS